MTGVTVRPDTLSRVQTARLLDVPEWFLDVLSAHRRLPGPAMDGSYPRAAVRRMLDGVPWMRRLGRPVSAGELAHIGRGLRIPPYRGVDCAGRRYCPLWECLAYAWKASPPGARMA